MLASLYSLRKLRYKKIQLIDSHGDEAEDNTTTLTGIASTLVSIFAETDDRLR